MNCINLTKAWLPAVLLLLSLKVAYGQEASFETLFSEAVKLSEENEHKLAFDIWTSLAKDHMDNGNINYRAGLAHLNTGINKKAALPYLERAIEIGINKNYDRFSPSETKSPVEAYYYLGKSHHLNNKLEDATNNYLIFLKESSRKHHMRPLAELGIKQAENAKIHLVNPVDFEITNLGPVINSEYADFSPVISVDENALFFTSSRIRPDSSNIGLRDRLTGEHFNDIYVSYKNREGMWQSPELLEINEVGHTATVNVSADGQILYVYRDDSGVGNVYESKLVGETWSAMQKIGGGINSNHWEPHIAVSVDGETAFLVSNRPGGFGGRDIYRAKKLPNGNWSEAQNMGPGFNTAYHEDAVFISPDGKTIYFSSEGHSSMGGFDIFYSNYNEDLDAWEAPVNMGYPINTTDDDVFFVTSADGRRAYYSSVREAGYGMKDIYMVNLPGDRNVQLALLMGKIFSADGSTIPEGITIDVINKNTRNTDLYTPRARDGGFVAILPPCYLYEVEYKLGGIVLATDTFSIECESSYQEIRKELLLNPLRIETDGTATIIRGDEGELIVSATTADQQPASFKRYFGYNENVVELEEEIFKNFMNQVKRLIDNNGKVGVYITGSASKVPTRTYGSNEKLAKLRANNAIDRIRLHAKNMGIDPATIEFIEVNHRVDGPAYKGDFREGKENYRQFQFIDIKAR